MQQPACLNLEYRLHPPSFPSQFISVSHIKTKHRLPGSVFRFGDDIASTAKFSTLSRPRGYVLRLRTIIVLVSKQQLSFEITAPIGTAQSEDMDECRRPRAKTSRPDKPRGVVQRRGGAGGVMTADAIAV